MSGPRTDTVTEHLTAGPATALHGLLGGPAPDLGGGLPLLWHWVYLLDRPAQDALGPDGHPARGSVQAPPAPGLARMWAGGRVRSLAPLRVDAPATRQSHVARVEEKVGRSGPLTFVTITHRVTQDDVLVVEEDQHLVYRPAGGPPRAHDDARPADAAPGGGGWELPVTPVLLFRFSALTYNAHRIHYDRDHARDTEGYPGLLVHGPLQAVAMAEAARRTGALAGSGSEIEYRLVAPLFDTQGLVVTTTPGGGGALGTTVRDHAGRVTASGTVRRTTDPAGGARPW